jgi:hypothetical protein
MTSRLPATPLIAQLRSVHARVRRALVLRHALRASAAAIVLLAFAVTAGLALPRTPGTAWARLALFTLGAGLALALAVRSTLRETPRWDSWLEGLEARFTDLRSWLRNALDLESSPGAHTSGELAGALRGEAERRLETTPLGSTVPSLAARTPAIAGSAALLSLTAALLLAPQLTLDAWHTLWAPDSAAPPIELVVEPGDVTLVPGASFAVRARVAGTEAPPRLLGNGAAPAAFLESTSDGARRWRFDLPPVTRPRDYAVKVAGLTSPRYHIALAGEPRPVSFSSTITAPAYARLPLQAISGTRGDLAALAGSRAAVEVTFDRDLESLTASVNGAPAMSFSELTPRRWRGGVAVNGDGSWELAALAATGEGHFRYKLSALPDAPPVLTVALPLGDLDLPAGQLVPYDVLAQDDLGVSELKLEWKKNAGDPWREQSLAAFRDEPREARATARWDASPLALLPGESGVFRFVALDNSRFGPRGRAVSSEFRVRFPSLNDLYAALDQKQDNVAKALEKAAEQTKELQKSLDKLERQPRTQTENPQNPSFERSEELKRATERQQAVAQQVDDAARQMHESLDQAAEREAFQQQLQAKLKEMSELLKDIQSQEFKDALKNMQEALKKMDRRAMEETLPQLQQQNKDMLQQLERSLELLKQLRQEERMDALARRADELKAKQDELNQQHAEQSPDPSAPEQPPGQPASDPKENAKQDAQADAQPQAKSPPDGDPHSSQPSLGERQKQAAQASRELAKSARDAAHESEDQDAQKRLQQAANELEQNAAEEQETASQQSRSGDSHGARNSGKQASESLSRAADTMRESAAQAQQEQDARNLAAVRRASQDLVSLSRAAQDNLEARQAAALAAEAQTDLSEGVARVADSLAALSQQTPFLSNKVSAALGRAMQGLSQSGKEMAQGGRERGEASGRNASASLNEAVKELRAAESSMCQKPGSGPGGKTSSQRLGEIGERQNQLNRQSREMARRLSKQLSMAQGEPAEMRRLADEQRRIREQLEEVRRDEEAKKSLLGRLDDVQKQMQKAEETLRQGETGDELEQQQTQILSRLLDAARSIHRRDFDPEREARRGEDVAHPSPAALSDDLFRENDRLRQDLLKADADRVPARYRSLIEAYLRSLNATSAAPATTPGTPR